MWIWILFAGLMAWLLWFMVATPGESHRGPLPPASEDDKRLAEALRRHVEAIAARAGNQFRPAELEAAARYLEKTLAGLGFQVQTQSFRTSLGEVRNIEVEVPGGAEIVIVGAHYDSVQGAPGGNDNGSGAAAALELARALREAKPARTLRFVFFVNEEPPFFEGLDMGSRRYALRAKEKKEPIAAMFSLETLGWYSDSPGSQRYPFPLGLFYPSTGDFVAFAYRYPYYHTPADTPDKVNYERLARVVVGMERMLRELIRSP